MRPILSLWLSVSILLTQAVPLAFAGDPLVLKPSVVEEAGDYLSQAQHQAVLTQQQADVSHRKALEEGKKEAPPIVPQGSEPEDGGSGGGEGEVSVPAGPSYDAELEIGQDLEVIFYTDNSSGDPRPVTLTIVITPLGSNDPNDSKEFSFAASAPSGSAALRQTITAEQLEAAGIVPGGYTMALIIADGETRVGEFFGQPFAIGSMEPTFTEVPTYTANITPGQDFQALFQIGNTGNAPAFVTLLIVLTRTGTNQSVEFYRTATIPVGGTSIEVILSAEELAAAGITQGNYTAGFIVYDVHLEQVVEAIRAGDYDGDNDVDLDDMTWVRQHFGQTVNDRLIDLNDLNNVRNAFGADLNNDERVEFGDGRIGQFLGNPFAIVGEVGVSFPVVPTYTNVLTPEDAFQATFTIGNSGSSPATVYVLAVITQAGRPSSSKEFYSLAVSIPVGGGSVVLDVTNAKLDAKGITGGLYTVTFIAYYNDQRIGGPGYGFFGNLLTIGEAAPLAFDSRPTFTEQVAPGGQFRATFQVGNTGTASQNATLLMVLRKIGDDPGDPNSFKEFYQPVTVAAGDGSFEFTLDTAAAGLQPGQYVVTFKVLDSVELPVGPQENPAERGYFGNLFTIG